MIARGTCFTMQIYPLGTVQFRFVSQYENVNQLYKLTLCTPCIPRSPSSACGRNAIDLCEELTPYLPWNDFICKNNFRLGHRRWESWLKCRNWKTWSGQTRQPRVTDTLDLVRIQRLTQLIALRHEVLSGFIHVSGYFLRFLVGCEQRLQSMKRVQIL